MAVTPDIATPDNVKTIAGGLAGLGYILYNEFISKRNATKQREVTVGELNGKVSALEKELLQIEERHKQDTEKLVETMRHKNELVLMQKELYEEERKVAAEEAQNEMRAAVRGTFSVLRSDIVARFTADLQTSSIGWTCDAGIDVCPAIARIMDANLLAYKGALHRAGDKAEELGETFALLNGYYGLGVSDLEVYLVSKNREIHRKWWDGMREEARALKLIAGLDADRVPEDYTLTYWRSLISTCIRIKTTEKKRISEAKRRFEGAVARIYGDRRENERDEEE